MFSNIGLPEILIILLIVLILFGAKRIPEVAGSLGKGINEFKRNMSEAQRAITEPPRDETRSIGAERDVPRPTPATPEEEEARQPKRLLG
ncbi:twin-arginine translocase TatA/TatE family subunit [Roseisolibacter sp. H3M3-2]|uniref:Sec-independent protein translocase subunit TatA/TatB n=1 Tax=Roseisolibacter sp. H3M3-2 TaxID=3031323 RepID=UPI0023DAA4EF|nr:twin-arginine translocase TatA/TatE family subunit [Roseisolibacter sp. H3M3-2]MDF1502705.1 twin-arginine translocase TatA/TatE family subunit [Roseisolibacter sp. H3M3-2]